MKIDFSKKLSNFYGEVITEGDDKKPLTLSKVCVEALLASDNRDPTEGVEKLRRYDLAKEINDGKKDSLSAEEVVLLKELIGKYYSTLIVGQVYPMLDNS